MKFQSIFLAFSMCTLGLMPQVASQTPPFRPAEGPPGFYAGALIIAREQLTKPFLTRYFNDLLAREDHPVVSVWVFTSNNEATDFWSGKLTDHIPYGLWHQAYDLRKDKGWTMARFFAIRGSGLLSITQADGSVEFVPLGKPDTTGLLSRNGASRILHTYAAVDHATPPQSHATFFIQTRESLTPATGVKLLDQIGELPFSKVFLEMRQDSWFIDAPGFPAFYPFEPRGEPPSLEAYSNSTTMVCSRGLPRGDGCSIFQRSGFDPLTLR